MCFIIELCKESQLYDVNPDVVEDGDNPDDIESNNNQESDTEVKTELWLVSFNLFIFPHNWLPIFFCKIALEI